MLHIDYICVLEEKKNVKPYDYLGTLIGDK